VFYVLRFGANLPWNDEWEFVPVLTGHEPVAPWLWRQHNEHRLPLPRLVYLAAFRLTHDYRTGSLIQVAFLSGVSLLLIKGAEALRGRPAPEDAFFPLVFLHWGHHENLLMGYQVCFALIAGLVGALAVVAIRAGVQDRFRPAAIAAILFVLLAACGATGLVYAAAGVAWIAWAATAEWRAGRRGRAVVLAGLMAVIGAYAGTYLVGYERPGRHPFAADPLAAAAVAAQYLAIAPGIGVAPVWPIAALGVGLVLAATGRTGLRWLGNRAGRSAGAGVLALLAGGLGLAVTIGIGRAGLGAEMGLWSRYSLLAAPLLAIGYLAAVRVGVSRIPRLLLAAAVLAFPCNTAAGWVAGLAFVGYADRFEADARNDIADGELVSRHVSHPDHQRMARSNLPLLRAAGIGAFGGAGPETRIANGVILALIVAIPCVLLALWPLRGVDPIALFRADADGLRELFRQTAAGSGKPRGLTWTAVEPNGEPAFVSRADNLTALLPVVVRFEPVPGSDMEGVPAARVPRPAVAVFSFDGRRWATAGRAVFNLSLAQVAERFSPNRS
jgi:hypothetical protein